MRLDALLAWGVFAGMVPFLAIVLILAHFAVQRIRWRLGWRVGYYPSTFALGVALQFVQVFYRPSVEHVVVEQLDERADEDESGGPEGGRKHVERQLRRIRRGERVERLVVRAGE